MKFKNLLFFIIVTLLTTISVSAQSTNASLTGIVVDEAQSVVTNAAVAVRNAETGFSRSTQTNSEGRYSFANLPIGLYELKVETAGFNRYVQAGITLDTNQNAEVNVTLKAGNVQETVTVTENASLLNTSTPEISTRFDTRRLSELPLATNRNVYNALLSVPGVSQLGSGQGSFANGNSITVSVNGGRVRSNNFMIDGQDINDPSVSGGQLGINNPDAIQEVRVITNQFLPEYGRNSGAVINFVGKSGTNDFHGSAFWFFNNEYLNSCSNLDKKAGFCNQAAADSARQRAPFRKENQIGFTFGGPLNIPAFGEGGPVLISGRDRTFFFGDFQRWTDRQQNAGFTVSGAPTAAGRTVLQNYAAGRPQIAALLRYLPAGTPNGRSATFTVGGATETVGLGSITEIAGLTFDNSQGSFRVDHRINDKNLFYGRYRFDDRVTSGAGQATPTGFTNDAKTRSQAATVVLNSVINSNLSNELRVAWNRFQDSVTASDPASELIPSIEVSELGLTGFNSGANRTAIGLAVNLPQFRANDTYQIQDAVTFSTGNHNLKLGIDFRKNELKSFFLPSTRGRVSYSSLNNFVNGTADLAALINAPIRGGDLIGYYEWREYYAYAQDEWRILPNLTLSYGIRYEYPGDSFRYLKDLNERIVAANGNDSRYAFTPVPKADKNNFMPRIGFNWNPRVGGKGIIGLLTGGDKLVLRGGYARTFDTNFININTNIFGSFPFSASFTLPAQNAFAAIQNPNFTISNPNQLARTVVAENFRSPVTDQFSFEIQRELTTDSVVKIGYIRTRGTGLFQTVDGNPRLPFSTRRVDSSRGVIRLRDNSGSSTYDALQLSFDKRLSRNLSAGFHYTYSSFLDTASEVFNPSGAEVAVAQDSFDRANEKARSSYDRPHRLTGNFVYELPFFGKQSGLAGKLLGGFQINSFFTFQSGAPFTVLNGLDPTGALSGIDSLVGNAIRPNIYTNLDVSGTSIVSLYQVDQQLRRQAIQQAQQIFNSLPPAQRVPGALPGAALNNTLFTRSVGRIVVANGQPNVVVDFLGLQPGQRVGNAGRNILRADSIRQIDFGLIKNTNLNERIRLQLRADIFNVFNERNFGIPEGRANAASFLDQWATNGGNRRIILGARVVF